ncbi:hypothetical protein COEREDRAFT_83552 [Coemansia reversa NRRL 1564]|uniref:Uncharacterized protein n=1 Tax=Coemansia reversa (strain ATCC 12441 / NRRL 1564) TaxID=763665 RepID=A0A2G5B2T0_COERN|nr:hypothetical protein COEREDRAFT_83552 [Coemansia reversa NRRL 1564]|eukprot:PIA13305.1 hypothetical protein COEREDRAFT_83552 [Coemansia reversa NRRL 1564]
MIAKHYTHLRSSRGSQLSISINASSSASLVASEFAKMPESPTTSDQTPYLPNYMYHPGTRINLQGSWLDLESDDELDTTRTGISRMHMRRKSSGASIKETLSAFSYNPLVNFRELTHRGSAHIRKLAGKVVH